MAHKLGFSLSTAYWTFKRTEFFVDSREWGTRKRKKIFDKLNSLLFILSRHLSSYSSSHPLAPCALSNYLFLINLDNIEYEVNYGYCGWLFVYERDWETVIKYLETMNHFEKIIDYLKEAFIIFD